MDIDTITKQLDGAALPTPEALKTAIFWTGPDKWSKIIRHHCFWKEFKIREGFDALVTAALEAHIGLVRAEATLTAYADSREQFHDHIGYTVAAPAQKEVMAFCAAYDGTIDTLRRLKKTRTDLADAIKKLVDDVATTVEFRFIYELRTNLSHGSVTVPGWLVRGNPDSASGSINFTIDELLAFGRWSPETSNFLIQYEDGQLPIASLTAHCAKKLAQLRRELTALFAKNLSPQEFDFYDLADTRRKLGSRQITKLFLQIPAQTGLNPLPHLHRFFPADVVREILRYPPNSAEQVEYIISQRSANTDCDDELRSTLYKIFGVTEQT